jgi:N-acyl homoserine lactone hydrolase
MTKRRKIVIGVIGLLPAMLFARTFCSSPLPKPPPFSGPLPSASPPPTLALFQLPTGVTHRSAGFAYRGGSFADKRNFAMTAALIRHPQGDLMIDTGFGRHVGEHFKMMPTLFRATTSYEVGGTAFDQLRAAGYDPKSLRAIVLTHAHWDHVSGLPEFPDTPVWITPEERRFIDNGGFVTAVARSCTGVKYEELRFEGPPYLGFPASRDVYGDGSIVLVPAPGHTPGSLIVFVTLAGDRRYAFVGDLVWQREGILEREERPWLQRSLADEDPPTLRESLLRMSAIVERFPALKLVPAHDARGYEGILHLR